MYSDLITAHSVVHERLWRASIPPQEAELRRSVPPQRLRRHSVIRRRSQPSTEEFNHNKLVKRKKRDVRVIRLASECLCMRVGGEGEACWEEKAKMGDRS